MKGSCVVFACTILSQDRLHVLQEFLKEFERGFADCDVYVGINPDSISNVEDVIGESKIHLKGVIRADRELYTQSDASAYQAALKLIRDSKETYETYWFVHTKGGVNSHSDYLRQWYINNFLADRSHIEQFLSEHSQVGSYGMLGVAYNPHNHYQEQDTEISLFENVITPQLPYTHANFFYIHTLYAIKGVIVDRFFELTTDKWFESKLDRYYFEGVFPFIVSRLGYFPYISNGIDMNGLSIVELNRSWLNQNTLVSYEKYLHLHRTNYYFNQLTPP